MQPEEGLTYIGGKLFPCTQCGECCRHINKIKQLEQYDNGEGVCINLVNNKCRIYPNRPDVCRGDYIYKKYFNGIAVDEFYTRMLKICDLLKKESDKA